MFSLFDRIEQRTQRIPLFYLLIFSYLFSVFRDFLESVIEEASAVGFHVNEYASFLNYFIHFPLFYHATYLMLTIFIVWFTGMEVKRALKFVLFFSFWILICPLVDLVLGGHFDLNYIMDVHMIPAALVNSFNIFQHTRGITYGMKVEGLLAVLGLGLFVYHKSKNILKGFLMFLLSYILIIVIGGAIHAIFAFITGHSTNSVFTGPGIIETPTGRYAMLLLFILVVFWFYLFFLYSKSKFFEFIKGIRWKRYIFYATLLLWGIFLGIRLLSFAYPYLFQNPMDMISIMSLLFYLFFGMGFAVMLNDYFDRKGDEASKFYTPIVRGVFTKSEIFYIIIMSFIFSLLFAFLNNYDTGLIAIVTLFISFLYSTPPYRLKKYYPISIFTIAVIALFQLSIGFSLLAKQDTFNLLPHKLYWLILIPFTLAFGTKDIKDVEGDRITGVSTLFTIFGVKTGRIVNAFLVLAAFLSIPLILGRSFLIVSLIAGLITFLLLLFLKNLKNDTPYMLILVAFMLFVGIKYTGMVKPPADMRTLFEIRAEQYEWNKNSLSAEKSLNSYIKRHRDLFAYYQLGLYAYDNGNLPRAESYLFEFIQGPERAGTRRYVQRAYAILAKIEFEKGNITEAWRLIFDAFDRGFRSTEYFTILGNIYMVMEDFSRGLLFYKSAFYLSPSSRLAFLIAEAYKNIGNPDSAAYYYNYARKISVK